MDTSIGPMDDARDWLRSRVERLVTWIDLADARLEHAAASSWREWVRLIGMSVGATAVVMALLQLLLNSLLSGGPGARWTGVVIAALMAMVLQVVVIRNVVISIAEPTRRRFLLVASLLSMAALLSSVAAFAAATAAVRSMPLWAAERTYLWQLADSIPLLAIPRRLNWTEAALTGGVGVRLTMLAFKLVVIAPLVRLVVALYELIEAQRSDPAALPRPEGTLLRRISRVRGLTPLAASAGFLVGGLGPGTELWRQLTSQPTTIEASILILLTFGIWAGATYWGAILGVLNGVTNLLLSPVMIALAAVVALTWFDTPVRRGILPFLSGGGMLAKLSLTVVLVPLVAFIIRKLWVFDGVTITAFLLLVGFVGADAPGRLWLLASVRWQPADFALGPALANAGVWYALAYLLTLLGAMPAAAARADLDFYPGLLAQRMREYLCATLQILAAAAAALVALSGPSALGVYASSTTPPRVDVLHCFVIAAWNVADAIPGPDIPAVLDWHLTSTVPGRPAGLIMLLTVLAVAMLVVFPIARSILGWARWKAAAEVEQPGLRQPEILAEHLRALQEFMEREPLIPDGKIPLAQSRRARDAASHMQLAERGFAEIQQMWGDQTPMHISAAAAMRLVRRAYATTMAGSRDIDELMAAQIFIDEFEFYVERWLDALRAGETDEPPLDPLDPAYAPEILTSRAQP